MSLGTLFGHDLLIIFNVVRKSLARWGDGLTLVLGIPLLILVSRAWLESLPDHRTHHIATGVLFFATFGLARLARERIEYHRSEGALARQALKPSGARFYLLVLIGSGLAMLAGIFLLMGLQIPATWLMAAPFGLAAGCAWHWVWGSSLLAPRSGWMRMRGRLVGRPVLVAIVGIMTGVVLVILDRIVGDTGMAVLTALLSLVAITILSAVDASKVRFMAQVGYSAPRTLALHLSLPLVFIATLLLPMLLAQQTFLSVVTAGVGGPVIAVTVTRVLAYRIYDRRIADWVCTLLLTVVALAAIPTLFAAPFVFLLGLGWLGRKSSRVTWLVQ